MTAERKSGLGGFICCVVGMEQYALAGADIRVVARAEYVKKGAGPANCVGTLRYGAETLPVYSLPGLFGRAPESSVADRYVIVTRGDGESFGLLVDRIVRTPAGSPALLPLPAAAGATPSAWFDGLLRMGDVVSCLVLSPRGIDPLAPAAPRRATPPIAQAAGGRTGAVASGMVLTFTSAALPSVQAAKYALAADRVGGIVQSLPWIPLPGAAPHIRAVGWWRDHAVPILRFNGEHGADVNGSDRFLVARSGGRGRGGFFAFRVGADVALHRATAADRRHAEVERREWFTRGIFSVAGDAVALLDVDAIIAGPGAVPQDADGRVAAAV